MANPTTKEYSRAYYRANKERYKGYVQNRLKKNPHLWKENSAAWRKAHPEYKRAEALKRRYGISLAQYEEMYSKQEGRCAICRRHQSELVRRLVVDHDHVTGNIRSLLCVKCNVGLSVIEDQEFCARASIYLGLVGTR